MDNQDGGDIDMVEGIPLQSVNSAILKKVRKKKVYLKSLTNCYKTLRLLSLSLD